MTNGGKKHCLNLGEAIKEMTTGNRWSEMNGDSPCNQGREVFWSWELQVQAPRHGGPGVLEAGEDVGESGHEEAGLVP